MNKLVKQVLALTGAMIAAWLIVSFSTRGRFNGYYHSPLPPKAEPAGFEQTMEGEGLVLVESIRKQGDYMQFQMKPEKPGDLYITWSDPDTSDQYTGAFRVTYDGHIVDLSNGNFSGDLALQIVITVYTVLLSLSMLLHFIRAKGPDFYSYETIYSGGFCVFALLSAALFLVITVRRVLNPAEYSMADAYGAISGSSIRFLFYTSPMILIFAVLMVISNVELLRHERKRLANVLGILISLVMVTGAALIIFFSTRNFSGSEMEVRIHDTVWNVVGTVYVYFECILLGSVICGLRAVKMTVDPVQDFLVILGCRFRKDGTLTPLLKGRVDRAIAFWKDQKEKTGKTAVFVPSGGQGPDESMPEAQAMRRYLLDQGVPDELILAEDQSKNTFQNMAFSKKLIDGRKTERRVAFSTTNYHVFRGGVWANLAGLKAEGIGSSTKWWFWPNAFMRECIGLFVNRWKQELIVLVILVAAFGTMSMFLH